MTFRVGQKVVCIRETKDILGPEDDEIEAHVGEIYTIRAIRVFPDGFPGFHVCEIVNKPRRYLEGWHEIYFDARRFRPIVERKTEVSFTAGADPSTKQFDNRRKVRVPA